MKEKKISVIVPVYNTEKYLVRCIESITAQTYRNIEIIAVNDGSTDGSVDLLNKLAQIDSRIIIVSHEKNKGLYHARLTGVKNASGDYIGFVDSDDHISCDYYRTLIEKAEETNSDIVVGRAVHEDENKNRWIHNLYHFLDYGTLNGDDIAAEYWRQEGRNFTWHTVWNKLYGKHIWEEAYPFLIKQDKHLIMTEDFVFSSVLFNYARKLTSVDYGAYFYFQNAEASTSNAGGEKKFRKNIGDLKTAFDFVKSYIENEYKIDVKSQFKAWSDLYKFFWQGNIENSTLPEEKKTVLYQLLEDSMPDYGNEIRNPSYFYEVTTYYDNRHNDIIDTINSKKIKCVSIDIFDTALLRPFYYPTDVFVILNKSFSDMCPSEKRSFSELRTRAEETLRKEKIYDDPQKEDISLDDIYEKIAELCNVDKAVLKNLQKLECKSELKFCRARKSILNIYKAALQLGKKIYFTSDMYLDKNFMKTLLEKNGYRDFSDILVSCEEDASKRTGKLFEILIEKCGCSNNEIIHIGDNWESDVVKAKSAGIKAFFYPAPLQCIQYNIPDIKSTHSCCPYSEPSGSMINFEKSLRFLGVRTALAVAANKLYDNPFIAYNEWSEMNCSPKYLGYYALGMHILGFVKWLSENAVKMNYDTLAFIARDGYLPMEAYKIIKKYYPNAPREEYLYTSRKASMIWGVKSADDLYALYDCINPKKCTPDEFARLIEPIIEKYDNAILTDNGMDCSEPFQNYGTFCKYIQIVINCFFSSEKCQKYIDTMSDYLKKKLSGKTGCVDIGYSGRTQELIKQLTGRQTDAFYMHTNDGEACEKAYKSGFQIYCFYDFTPSITGGIREVLISKYAPSCIGYDIDSTEANPVFEETDHNYIEWFLMNEVQKNCLDFIRDFCGTFGEYLDIMDMRNVDISYPYEYFLATLTDVDAHMFDCISFEDDMWLGKSVAMAEYWKECIRYHKILPYYMQKKNKDIPIEYDTSLSYKLFYQNGIDKKSKMSKAAFWLAVDRKLFKEKIKEAFLGRK